jgi:hypothetical protein
VPLFPLTPLFFAVTSGAMVYAGIQYALSKPALEAWWAIIVVATGVIVGLVDWKFRHVPAKAALSRDRQSS